MSNGKKKTPSIDAKLVAFSDRVEETLTKERKERAAERKEFDAKLEKERKEFDAKLEKERKEHRRDVAVEMGRLQDMWGKLAEFVIESGILDTLNRHADLSIDEVLP